MRVTGARKQLQNLPRTLRYVQFCLSVKFNNAWENHWKPLFALISARILLKQLLRFFALDFYEAIVDLAFGLISESPHRNLELIILLLNRNTMDSQSIRGRISWGYFVNKNACRGEFHRKA